MSLGQDPAQKSKGVSIQLLKVMFFVFSSSIMYRVKVRWKLANLQLLQFLLFLSTGVVILHKEAQ
jgi:hypothetical protein